MPGQTQPKPASSSTAIHELLALRWSGRAFDPNWHPDDTQVMTLLEAARWAPSCYGDEPWRYLLFRRAAPSKAWQDALECLSPGNQKWAGQASLLFLALADTRYSQRAEDNRWGDYDSGAASLSLCLQATALGLMTHQMGGFDPIAARRRFAVPERYRLMAFIAVGQQLPQAQVPLDLRASESARRRRRPLQESVYLERWGNPLELAPRGVSPAPDAGQPPGSAGVDPVSSTGVRSQQGFLPLGLAVLTVSDSRDEHSDKSGALLVKRLRTAGHRLVEKRIVPDDIYRVRAVVAAWCVHPEVAGVLISGGTGVTGRDGTPDAVAALLDKRLDGFGELFRWLSWEQIGTSSMQSRALGGVCNGRYIFSLPGSSGACSLAWDRILCAQLDRRTKPCNLVELLPRMGER